MSLRFVAHEDRDRGAVEVPVFAYLVFQKTAVGFLDPLWQITEEYECRDDGLLEHRDIFYLHEFAFVAGRRSDCDLLKHVGVELGGRYDAAAVLVDVDCCLQHLVDALFCDGRGEDDREVGEGGELAAYGLFETFLGLKGAVFGDIPFVDADHKTLLVALDEAEYIAVLGLYAACGVDHQYADIGCLYGADGAYHGVIFDVFVHLLLLPYAGGVDEIEVEAEFVVSVID